MPTDEGIVIWIETRCRETPPPIASNPESRKILDAISWEVPEELVWILKIRDLGFGNSDLLEDGVLALLSSLVAVVIRGLACFDLTAKVVRGGHDRHASTVEGEGEKHVVSIHLLEPRAELGLRHGISMPEVKSTVDIRIGEGHEEFLRVVWIWVGLVRFV